MTEILGHLEPSGALRWMRDAREELFDNARHDLVKMYGHVVVQAVKEGGSIKRATRQFSYGNIAALLLIDSELDGFGVIGHADQLFGGRAAEEDEVHRIEDDSFSLLYRAADSYSEMEPSEAIRRLCGLQMRLGESAQYVASVALRVVSHQPHPAMSAQPLLAEAWVESSISLERAGQREKALDVLFDHIDDLLLSSKFRECDITISSMPVERLSNAQLLTVLTATAAAKDHLPSRAFFYERTKAVLHSRSADANSLLSGLE